MSSSYEVRTIVLPSLFAMSLIFPTNSIYSWAKNSEVKEKLDQSISDISGLQEKRRA